MDDRHGSMLGPKVRPGLLVIGATAVALLVAGCSGDKHSTPAVTVTVQQTVTGSAPATSQDSSTAGSDVPSSGSTSVAPSGPDSDMRGPDDTNAPVVEPTITPKPVPTGRAGVPRGGIPAAASIKRSSPSATGAAAMKIIETQDAAIDRSIGDAYRRASFLFTPSFATGITTAVDYSDADFATMASHHGYTVVTVGLGGDDGRPKDTTTAAYYQYVISVQTKGDGGWRAPTRQLSAFVRLTRSGASQPWQVADIEFA